MKAVNVDAVLKILDRYGKYIFVTDYKKYSDMVDDIANLESLKQGSCDNCESDCEECNAYIKGYNKGFHDGMFGGAND